MLLYGAGCSSHNIWEERSVSFTTTGTRYTTSLLVADRHRCCLRRGSYPHGGARDRNASGDRCPGSDHCRNPRTGHGHNNCPSTSSLGPNTRCDAHSRRHRTP